VDPKNSKAFEDYDYSVVYGLKNAINILNTKNFNYPFDGQMLKSWMLRLLIHFMGDFHQPLH